MGTRRVHAAVVLVVALATLIVPSAIGAGSLAYGQARAKAKASVVNHDANLRGDGTVPVKVHCAAAEGNRCKGTLRLVVKLNGTNISNSKQGFVVRGKKNKMFHLQATGSQLELFMQAGTRDAIVKVKEKKPLLLAVHSAVVAVHVPT